MAAVVNVRDVFLESEPVRTNSVVLPVGISIDYSNVENSPLPNNYTISTSNPTGGNDGDYHFNSSTSVLWVKVNGTWTAGGTLSASQITTGTLAAARIGTNSITASKISVSTLSAIAANLGTVTAGSITGTADISIAGTAKFDGTTPSGGTNYAGVFNESQNTPNGVYGWAGTNGIGVLGGASGAGTSSIGVAGSNTSGKGVMGSATNGIGVYATASIGTALHVQGKMTISSTSLVSNLNADMLDGSHGTSFCKTIDGNSGVATVSSSNFNILCTVAGVTTVGSGASITIQNTSDRRLKHDIKSESLGLNFINRLKPVTYRMNNMPEILYHGFIAQDMEGIIDIGSNDCLYRKNPDGYYGVDYVGMIAPLVRALQELTAKVESLNIH